MRNPMIENLHSITIITLPDDKQHRVAAKTLIDQCCMDKGLISWNLVDALGHPTSAGDAIIFTITAGTFSTNEILQINEAMLPCLSSNWTFTIELMVVPKESLADLNYGVILGQDTMQALDLDTSVLDNMISWGELQFSMVPQYY